jgi:ubiquinone/menaquinone biosynthesis C-methylase UbiE
MHAPSADRNKGPIVDALRAKMPFSRQVGANVLEVGSGTGQHALHFSTELNVKSW